MFISSVKLKNWRAYSDVGFEFPTPTHRRPLVLIGAQTGVGKTSFLVALYLGLFGRFGLRHAEGYSAAAEQDLGYYREAITAFRRNTARPEEPTRIEVTFKSTNHDADDFEIRIARVWHFSLDGRPKSGDAFEEVQLEINGKLVHKPTGMQAADWLEKTHDLVEKNLFPAHLMPAFFFDGEQAQSVIAASGADGLRKAVAVLYGTTILQEVREQVNRFISTTRSRAGGKRASDGKRKLLEELETQYEADQQRLIELRSKRDSVFDHRVEVGEELKRCIAELQRLGGDKTQELARVAQQLMRAQATLEKHESELKAMTSTIGAALGLVRLRPALENRLDAEAAREEWEGLRKGVESRSEPVLARALPEPPTADELLGHLSVDLRTRVRQRFAAALEHIYNPQPVGCASEYLLGHVKGEARDQVRNTVARLSKENSSLLRQSALEVRRAREAVSDAEARQRRLGEAPSAAEELRESLGRLQQLQEEDGKRINALEAEIISMETGIRHTSEEIGRLRQQVQALEPQERRARTADDVRRALDEILLALEPLTLQKLESEVSEHFIKIVDARFKNGSVRLTDSSGKPAALLCLPGQPDQRIESMSGFERRSFGIAFSLALMQVTEIRMPLVIDTPLGNADSEYRPRLLRALMDVDLDQIILLPHDLEITPELYRTVEKHVGEKYLVKFDRTTRESFVIAGEFFGGSAL